MKTEWIALDWGTTRLRAFAMGSDGQVLARASSDDGMGALSPGEFEPALLSLIAPWLGAPRTLILAAGMVGARQGWVEAPYLAAPCAPLDPARFQTAPTNDVRLDMRIAPGVAQSSPPDVMRGEEVQIAGFLAAAPDFDGVICLPGTHSKWVRVSAGEIVGFRTFMTGELFALLSNQSVLRHSLDDAFSDSAFEDAVAEGLISPEQITARLFSLRAESLLSDPAPGVARASLSGWLIGQELAATRHWWLGADVALIGAEGVAARYQTALDREGVIAPLASAEDATLAGLNAAKRLMETAS